MRANSRSTSGSENGNIFRLLAVERAGLGGESCRVVGVVRVLREVGVVRMVGMVKVVTMVGVVRMAGVVRVATMVEVIRVVRLVRAVSVYLRLHRDSDSRLGYFHA